MDAKFANPSISTLRSCLVINDDEAWTVQQSLMRETQKLLALDKSIEALTIVLQDLNWQREKIQTACDVSRELLSPMRRLPVEILQKIFAITIPSLDLSLHTILSSRVCNPGQPHPDSVRRKLMSVCHRWRNITVATPSLWTNVSVDPESGARLLQNHFLGSKAMPMDVHLYRRNVTAASNARNSLPGMRLQAADPSGFPFRCIKNNISRMRSAIFDGERWLQSIGTELFPITQKCDFPNLETLAFVAGFEPDLIPKYWFRDKVIHAPNLRSLIMAGAFEHVVPGISRETWGSIRVLSIGFPRGTTQTSLDRISRARNLELLDYTDGLQDVLQSRTSRPLMLRIRRNYPNGIIPSFKAISFPSVKTFHFSGDDPETYYHVLNAFHVPAVMNLGLNAPQVNDGTRPLSGLDTFLWIAKHQMNNLQQLFLGHFFLSRGDMMYLETLPNLRKLVLFECSLDGKFFQTLKAYNIPALNKVVIYSCKFSFDDLRKYIQDSSNVTIVISITDEPTKGEVMDIIRLAALSTNYPNLVVEYSHLTQIPTFQRRTWINVIAMEEDS